MPEQIDQLIDRLRGPYDHHTARATEALVRIGAPALERLCVALTDNDEEARRSAAFALGRIGDARAIEPLVMALDDPSKDVRRSAALALGRIGVPAVERLCQALDGQNRMVRFHAAQALLKVGDGQTLPRKVLTDGRLPMEERLSALDSLHAAGRCEPVLDLLQQLASDGEQSVRDTARVARSAWTLLRPSTRAEDEGRVLLRPATGPENTTPPELLMRASETPAAPPNKAQWWWRWKKG